MSKLKIVFLIIYNIFLMNGGLALLLTEISYTYRIAIIHIFIIQYRHKIKKNIARSELKYVLLRLILIAIVGGRCVEDIGLFIGKANNSNYYCDGNYIYCYKKWLTSDLDRIK